MEREKMVKGKKAEGKEVTAQVQNQFVNQKMGSVKEKGAGAGTKAEMIEHSRQNNSHRRGKAQSSSAQYGSITRSELRLPKLEYTVEKMACK